MSTPIRFDDEHLSTLPDGCRDLRSRKPPVSPNMARIMYEHFHDNVRNPKEPGRTSVISNHVEGPTFETTGPYQCSQDGRAWAYLAVDSEASRRGRRRKETERPEYSLMLNGEKKTPLALNRFFLSLRGDSVAYEDRQPHPSQPAPATLSKVIINGVPGPAFEVINCFGYSSQSVFAYHAEDGATAKQYVFVGEQRSGPYQTVSEFCWSPDGGRFAFVAQDYAKQEYFVVDTGKRGPMYESAPKLLRFSDDGKFLAYECWDGRRYRVVVEGAAGPGFFGANVLRWSPDGRRLVYLAWEEKRHRQAVVVNHQFGRFYDKIGQLGVSQDGETVAYTAREANRWFVVTGAEESDRADAVQDLTIGGWGGVAFILVEGSRSLLIHNRRKVFETTERAPYALTLNRGGSKLAYAHETYVVVDGKRTEGVNRVESLMFAPDGKTAIYRSVQEEGEYLVIGGRRYGPMYVYAGPEFNESGDRLAVVAQIGREIWRKIYPVDSSG